MTRSSTARRIPFGVDAVVVLALFAMFPAHAVILSSSGGRVGDYLQIFAQLRAFGERIIIDGPCLSLPVRSC